MKKIIIVFLILLLSITLLIFLIGRSDLIHPKDYQAYDHFVMAPRLKKHEHFNAIELSIINTATAPSKKGIVIGGESMLENYTISHSAILIKHNKGTVLFDTGLGSHIDEQFLEMPSLLQPLLEYNFIEDARTQLSDSLIKPHHIILSHLHWDHAGGIEDFPDAKIWTSKNDLDNAMEKNQGSLKSQLDNENIHWNYVAYENKPYENFSHSLDFFGDGSLIIVPLPGHTLGSIGLFVNLSSGHRYLLTGDATYGVLGFSKPAEKSWMLKYAIDANREQLITTILKIHYLMKKYPDLIVVPAHDAQIQNQLKQFQN